MNIEKKKVTGSAKVSSIAKRAIAVALGITASVGMTACDDIASATSKDNSKKEPEPTCGIVECGYEPGHESKISSTSQDQTQSSSSNVIDIPKSYEHYSSSAIKTLSSAARPISSSISAGVPHVYSSSSTMLPSSSSAIPIVEAGVIPPLQDFSSSSIQQPVSSSSNTQPNPTPSEFEVIKTNPSNPAIKDTLIPQIHLCKDPNNPGCLMESMVTTLETDDIA